MKIDIAKDKSCNGNGKLKSIVIFLEQVECFLRITFSRFVWDMARAKQNQRRINEGRPELVRFKSK